MTSGISDAATYFKTIAEHIVAAFATDVDSTCHDGDEENRALTEESKQNFKCRAKKFDNTQLAAGQIETKSDGTDLHWKRVSTN